MKESLAGQIWIEQFMSETDMTKHDQDLNRSRVTSTNIQQASVGPNRLMLQTVHFCTF